MKIDKLSFPHPVLISDDREVSGDFRIDFEYSLGNKIELSADIDLENDYLINSIESGKASFCMEVDCKATIFKKIFKFKKSRFSQKMPSSLLWGEVDVTLFVLAEKGIKNYTPEGMHFDYEDFNFSVNKGDILAYGDSFTFVAVKDSKKLKSPESLIRLKKGNKKQEPMRVVLENDIIEVFLSEKDFKTYKKIQNSSRKMVEIFHSAIVLPALVYAINAATGAGEEFQGLDWYEIIKHRVKNEMDARWHEGNTMEIAQNLLEAPVRRSIEKGWGILIDYSL